MAQEKNIPENACESPVNDHKGSSFAVSSAQWYIAECKPTRERTIREMLKKAGYEAYVASQKEKHRYKSGNIRIVEHVILSGRVFVNIEKTSLVDIMTTFSSIYRFQINRAAGVDKCGNKPFAFVPKGDMDRLQRMLDGSANPVIITDMHLALDQEVKVVSGPLKGLEGRFYRKGSTTYIVIKVAMGSNYYAYAELSAEDVKVIG